MRGNMEVSPDLFLIVIYRRFLISVQSEDRTDRLSKQLDRVRPHTRTERAGEDAKTQKRKFLLLV